MKIRCLLILLILILTTGNLSADSHRIGVGMGSVSGEHEQYGETEDMKGELLEMPVYTYTTNGGLMVGFRLMELSLSGELTSGLQRTDLSFRQTLLAASVGYEIQLGKKLIIAPQIVKSYFGNSQFQYSIYNTITNYTSYSHQYVAETDTVTGTADLSGWEIPIYYAGDYFFFGLKYSSYSNSTDIDWTNGAASQISASSALSIVLDASF